MGCNYGFRNVETARTRGDEKTTEAGRVVFQAAECNFPQKALKPKP